MSDQIRAWAAKNAFTLIFLALMFVVTWVVIVMANYVFG